LGDQPALRLFGGPTLFVGGREADLGQPAQRRLVAALAVDVGSVVPVDVLVERMWDGAPPVSAVGSLQAHLTRVRAVLQRSGASPVVARRGGGYVLDADPESVDVGLFRSLRRQADLPGTLLAERADLLDRALSLWVGPALVGLSGAWPDRVRVGLDHEVLEVALAWAEHTSNLGLQDLVAVRLRKVQEQFPRVEPLAGQLIRALHLAGRDSEAVEVYLSVRRRLGEELGIDPGPALRAVYEAVLRDEVRPVPAQVPSSPTPTATSPVGPRRSRAGRDSGDVPRQLPPAVSVFVGRERELAVLDAWLNGRSDPVGSRPGSPWAGALVISAVSGTAGVGKTALAVHWGHLVADRFPQGQLYVNLRGYDPDPPLAPTDALARMLLAMGVSGAGIPAGLDERAALYRTLIADRRVLILLDNVGSVEQVRPLLPGTPGCVVVVTSRDPLAGLVARDGARRLDLDVLGGGEASDLLRRLIGPAAGTDPEAVSELADRCQRLPLALRVAAERVAANPRTGSLRDLVAELDGSPRGLDVLDASGDPLASVRGVFSWSYRYLTAGVARMFRLLAVEPTGQVDVALAAALCDVEQAEAREHLDVLLRAHLVQPAPVAGYVTMHDLLRAYASELAARHDGHEAVRAAQVRFLQQYLMTAVAALDLAEPHDQIMRTAFGAPPCHESMPLSVDGARSWLDLQDQRPRDIITFAGTVSPRHALALAASFYRAFRLTSSSSELIALSDDILSLARAQQRSDAIILALTMASLGLSDLGDSESALKCCDEALDLARQTRNATLQCQVLLDEAWLIAAGGRIEQAWEAAEEGLALARDSGDVVRQIQATNYLAGLSYQRGDLNAGLLRLRKTLEMAEHVGDPHGLAQTLTNLAEFEGESGQLTEAIAHLQRALAITRDIRSANSESVVLANLAQFLFRAGDLDASLRTSRDALRTARRIGDTRTVSYALVTLADGLKAAGRTSAMRRQYARALDIATKGGFEDAIKEVQDRLRSLDAGQE
jgi:DNA-binding SARP family transcriptional activator/tetratricopeptide (TPR) repeat protein